MVSNHNFFSTKQLIESEISLSNNHNDTVNLQYYFLTTTIQYLDVYTHIHTYSMEVLKDSQMSGFEEQY